MVKHWCFCLMNSSCSKKADHINRPFHFVDTQKGKVEADSDQGLPVARQIEVLDSILGWLIAPPLGAGSRGIARFYAGKALSAQWPVPERVQTGTSLNKTRLTARGITSGERCFT